MNHPRARKRFGQNFLVDQAIIHAIIDAIGPRASEALVEIGPGHGALTDILAVSGSQLDLIELDRDLCVELERKYQGNEKIRLHSADALSFDFRALASTNTGRLRVVGNLPYNISTPLLFHLISHIDSIHDMHFMLQKEVVDRIVACPGEKNYGRLSVMLQYYCQAMSILEVPPEAFTPQPKVISAVIRLIPKTSIPQPANDTELLEKVVKAAFSQRRKTLRNTLKDLVDSEQLQKLGVDPSQRAETLTVEQFVAISNSTKG